jgi:hypothetical protein
VRNFLRVRFPHVEGWYVFTSEEFQMLVNEMTAWMATRKANRRSGYFQAKSRR